MQTKAERMAMIRNAAKKFQAKQTRAARFTRVERASDISREVEKKTQEKQQSEIYWTDGSQYANQYYGETYRETTRFDNDWD